MTAILTAIFLMTTWDSPISAKTRFIQDTRSPGVTILQGKLSPEASQFNSTLTRSYSEDSQSDGLSLHACTLNIGYDSNLYSFIDAYAAGPNTIYYLYRDHETDRFLIDVPEGTYDFCFVWKSLSDGANNIVIKEGIEVSSDISVDVNAAEATECIHFSVVKMDGQKLVPYTVEYDPDWNLKVVEEGNTDTPMLNLVTSLYRPDYPTLTSIYFSSGNVLANEYAGAVAVESYQTIHINPELYKYTVNHQEVFFDGGYVNGVCFEWQSGDATEITNDPDSYIFNEVKFIDTPLHYKSNVKPVHYEASVEPDSEMYPDYIFNFMSKGTGGGLSMETDEVDVCRQAISLTNTYIKDNYFLSLWRTDYAQEEEDWVSTFEVRSCSIGFDDSGFTYNSLANGSYNISPDGSEKSMFDNPFAFPYKGSPIVFGNNTPFMKFTPFNGNYMMVASIGQKGENRKSDLIRTSSVLKNGTEVVEEFNTTPRILTIPQETTSDQWTLETLNTNVMTMGIEGSNTSILNFRTAGNIIQPLMVIQAIQMRDAVENVTVDFTDSEDARVCVAGGLFSLNENPELFTTWYSCAEEVPEVEIWVAPHGEKEWHPLEVINCPDKFYMPGLGHYFEASLAGTQDYCDLDGWCDLKVSMKNKDGDCNTQLLSPGFRIGNLSAVTEVSTEPAFTIVDGCIKVQAGGRIFGIDGREYHSTLLPGGCYVVLLNGKAYKIAIP